MDMSIWKEKEVEIFLHIIHTILCANLINLLHMCVVIITSHLENRLTITEVLQARLIVTRVPK